MEHPLLVSPHHGFSLSSLGCVPDGKELGFMFVEIIINRR